MGSQVIINTLRNQIIIVNFNKLADGVGSDIKIPRDPSGIDSEGKSQKASRANTCRSDFLLPLRIDATFWLSEYQMTLVLDKSPAKASKARQTALSSLQVELCTFSSGDQSCQGPFIFYEVGGAGGIWGGVTEKKPALKGGPSKKYKGKRVGHVKYFSNALRWDMFYYS